MLYYLYYLSSEKHMDLYQTAWMRRLIFISDVRIWQTGFTLTKINWRQEIISAGISRKIIYR